MKFTVRAGCPRGYEPDAGFVARARDGGAEIVVTADPREAIGGARVVVTDTWVSMGQPAARRKSRR